MKTGTSCTRCANAATCPRFDSHVLEPSSDSVTVSALGVSASRSRSTSSFGGR